MCVHPHHGLSDLEGFSLSQPCLDVQPLFEPLDEGLLGDRLGLLTENATTEHVIEAAACPEQTAGLGIIVLVRHYVL